MRMFVYFSLYKVRKKYTLFDGVLKEELISYQFQKCRMCNDPFVSMKPRVNPSHLTLSSISKQDNTTELQKQHMLYHATVFFILYR